MSTAALCVCRLVECRAPARDRPAPRALPRRGSAAARTEEPKAAPSRPAPRPQRGRVGRQRPPAREQLLPARHVPVLDHREPLEQLAPFGVASRRRRARGTERRVPLVAVVLVPAGVGVGLFVRGRSCLDSNGVRSMCLHGLVGAVPSQDADTIRDRTSTHVRAPPHATLAGRSGNWRPRGQVGADADEDDHRARPDELRSTRTSASSASTSRSAVRIGVTPQKSASVPTPPRVRRVAAKIGAGGRSADSSRAVLPSRVTATIASAWPVVGERDRRFAERAAVQAARRIERQARGVPPTARDSASRMIGDRASAPPDRIAPRPRSPRSA